MQLNCGSANKNEKGWSMGIMRKLFELYITIILYILSNGYGSSAYT